MSKSHPAEPINGTPPNGRPVRNVPANPVLDKIFAIGLIFKGLDGVIELIGGLILLVATPAQIQAFVGLLTREELAEDATDWLANLLVHGAHSLTASATLFSALYLLTHGVVKVVLVWAVLKNQLWAYPWMVAALIIFMGFQVQQMFVHFTWGLLALTLFDGFIVWLTLLEYRKHRRFRTPTP